MRDTYTSRTIVRFAVALWTLGLLAPSGATGQTPVPLADSVTEPLLPPAVLPHDVNIDGQLAYLWDTPEGEHVIHMVGDFEMVVGDRTLTADQGVVWMRRRRFENRDYQRFEVFLFRRARVVEPAGTINEGPLLLVTLDSSGEVFVSADRTAHASSADTPVYQDAATVRARLRPGGDADRAPETEPPTPVEVKPPPRQVFFSANRTIFQELDDGQPVVVASGQVNVLRTDPVGFNPIELHADAAVLFLKRGMGGEQAGAPLAPEGERTPVEAPVAAAYLEGDIRMSSGDRTIRAERLYYDLELDRALILDAVIFGMVPNRDLPVYFRAAEIRQLSEREFAADDAILTTSEFHTPHYHLGAERIEITDKTLAAPGGERLGLARAGFKVRHATFNLYNTPLFYWPAAAGDVSLGESPIRGISVGSSEDFGTAIETEWDLFNLLSWEAPRGFSGDLLLDYFSKRGPATGLNVDYERENYFGLFKGYVIDDGGDDNLGRLRDNKRDDGTRGRALLRHRHYLPDDWELTWELSYISDRGFLEEYFEREFDEGKDQESVFYAKKQRDNWAFTILWQGRINDFLTQTERYPDVAFRLIGEPVGNFATWFSENRAGVVRYRAAEKGFFLWLFEGSDGPSSGGVLRADTRQELDVPLAVGPVKVVPFAAARGTVWNDSPESGNLARGFGVYGLRAATYLSKTFPDVESDFWDVHGLRHVIKPDLVAWGSHTNVDSEELFPFDAGVEGIDDFDGAQFGVRQRWQTKRGPAGQRRTVDWVTLDTELGVFNDNPGVDVTNGFVSYSRPEESVARNYLNNELLWRINDSTALSGEVNYDLNDSELDVFNVAVAVDRSPRFSYLVGYRYIDETSSSLMGIGMDYKIDEKHRFAIREEFDLQQGDTLGFSIGYIRKFPRWYVSVVFEIDEAEDNTGVSFSVWPEGLPRATLGARRFTGLASATALTRD